ncbi:hypothetical protein V1512DRAFT_260838 [Lipomyces arxii]|uniref:uncharacterized protein n=1 Tax=Lipomyces arxii TaxID=56418 RepID=UPI0034CDAF47
MSALDDSLPHSIMSLSAVTELSDVLTSPPTEASSEQNDVETFLSRLSVSDSPNSAEMVALAPNTQVGEMPTASPLPAPQPSIGKSGVDLQSILDQFDPLALHSPTEDPRPSSSRSSSKSSSHLSRSSSTISTASKTGGSIRPAFPTRSTSKGSDTITVESAASEKPSHKAPTATQRPSLPRPEDQPAELPFDFSRFHTQLRHKGAEPLSRYLKSFLHEFGKRSWTVREQVKIVQDFQNFITPRMSQYPPFNNLPDTEIANALEGMEKLIMSRLYLQTFSPEIPRSRRTFSHDEDLLRDNVLEEKMRIWSWIEGSHLDVDKDIVNRGERFVLLAEDELKKINRYRAPRDKVICVLNCCKVIFGLLRQTKTEESADKFLPILILVVIRAAPKHLISNVQYIMRFRNPDKLNGEAGYYLSSLQGAIAFIESLDRNSLNITDEEFEERVTQSVAKIQINAEEERKAEISRATSPPSRARTQTPPSRPFTPSDMADVASDVASQVHEALSATFTAPFKQFSKLFDGDGDEEQQRPGVMARTRDYVGARRNSAVFHPVPATSAAHRRTASSVSSRPAPPRTLSEETQETQRQDVEDQIKVTSSLKQMFPNLEPDVIEDVVVQQKGRLGASIDACLLLTQD